MPGKQEKTKVFWTSREQEVVAKVAAFILHRGEASSMIRAVAKAQEQLLDTKVMPRERAKVIQGVGSIKLIAPLITAEIERLKKAPPPEPEAVEIPVLGAAVAPALSAAVAPATALAPVEATAPLPQPSEPFLAQPGANGEALNRAIRNFAEVLATELEQALRLRITRAVSEAVIEALNQAKLTEPQPKLPYNIPAFNSSAPRPAPAPVREKLRVLVLGPMNGQQRILEDEFGEVLELRFVSSQEGEKRVQQVTQSWRGLVVCWIPHIQHSWEDIARKNGHEQLVRVAGGMSELKDTLMRLLVSDKETA